MRPRSAEGPRLSAMYELYVGKLVFVLGITGFEQNITRGYVTCNLATLP